MPMTQEAEMRGWLAAIGLWAVALPVHAAPFCVVDRTGQRCWYYNADSCRQAAARTDGQCVYQDAAPSQQSNPYDSPQWQGSWQGSQPSQPSGAPFCVATSYAKNCFYYSRSQCEQAAERQRGACILNQ